MRKVRRVPRKIGQDDDDAVKGADDDKADREEPIISVVRRPILAARGSSKVKKSSDLRKSFTPGGGIAEDTDEVATSVAPVRTSNLSRLVLERNTEDRLPLRTSGLQDDRPSYSKDYLDELKKDTPTTPRELRTSSVDVDSIGQKEIDIASKFGDVGTKFGSTALTYSPSEPLEAAIPTDAEIREKKERRRRLAKEQDFISLNDTNKDDASSHSDDSANDDPRNRSLIIPADEIDLGSKYGETRLIHDDEDIAEGFDSFVEDAGKVTLGRKAAKEQERQRRSEIAAQIRSAQHGYGYGAGMSGDEDDEDDGEAEVDREEVARNAAYEAAQTRAGTYGVGSNGRRWEREKEEGLRRRLEVQPKIRPIPELKTVVARFWDMVREKEAEVAASKRRLGQVVRERVEIEQEEERIKELLKEAGERYEKLRAENGGGRKVVEEKGGNGEKVAQQRGLESLGAVSSISIPVGAEQREEESPDSPAPLVDDVMSQMGMRSFSGMGQVRREEDEYSDV